MRPWLLLRRLRSSRVDIYRSPPCLLWADGWVGGWVGKMAKQVKKIFLNPTLTSFPLLRNATLINFSKDMRCIQMMDECSKKEVAPEKGFFATKKWCDMPWGKIMGALFSHSYTNHSQPGLWYSKYVARSSNIYLITVWSSSHPIIYMTIGYRYHLQMQFYINPYN